MFIVTEYAALSSSVYFELCLQLIIKHTERVAIENVNTIGERRSESLQTVFSIAICLPTGDKWQSKTLFLHVAIFDQRLSIVKNLFDLRLSGVLNICAICVFSFPLNNNHL